MAQNFFSHLNNIHIFLFAFRLQDIKQTSICKKGKVRIKKTILISLFFFFLDVEDYIKFQLFLGISTGRKKIKVSNVFLSINTAIKKQLESERVIFCETQVSDRFGWAVQDAGAMEAPHTLLFAVDSCPQKM